MAIKLKGEAAARAVPEVEATLELRRSKKTGLIYVRQTNKAGKHFRVVTFRTDGKLFINDKNQASGLPVDSAGKVQVASSPT